MLKKLTLLAMSLAAMVAFAAPATAQANPIVENALGEEAFEIYGESSGYVTWTTSAGKYQCYRGDLALSGSEGSYSGTGDAEGSVVTGKPGPCVLTNGWQIEIDPMTVALDLNGGGTGTADISYTYTYSNGKGVKYNCSYTGNNLSVSYTPGSSQLTIQGQLNGTGCHSLAIFEATYDITDEYGEKATLN